MKQQSSMSSQVEAFNGWHAQCKHLDGTLKIRDKAIGAAINKALEALLTSSNAIVTPADIESWILQNLGFRVKAFSTGHRVDDHCLYEAGEHCTPTKTISQPKKNSTLRIVSEGVYALVIGAESYVFHEISHRRKSKQ